MIELTIHCLVIKNSLMTIGTNTHVLSHVLPQGMQGMDVSLSGQIFRVSEKLMTQVV